MFADQEAKQNLLKKTKKGFTFSIWAW